MDVEAEVFEPLELPFTDLLSLSSSSSSIAEIALCQDEFERLESLSAAAILALGPTGPGLLSITGVPRAPALRRALLPLARKLALLDRKDRARILKEHGLGSDVPLKNPDRTVSSFSSQLKYEQDQSLEVSSRRTFHTETDDHIEVEDPDVHRESCDDDFKHLRDTFKELGCCMIEIGLRLAQICDKVIGGRILEESIMESCSAKGRLIHYHSMLDNLVLKDNKRKTNGASLDAALNTHDGLGILRNKTFSELREEGPLGQATTELCQVERKSIGNQHCTTSLSNLWQQWHYDYGIFTVLTTPMFMSSHNSIDCICAPSNKECSSPAGHSYLQIFDSNNSKILVVKSPPESFIVQVGESANILSGGRLHSTLHSVGRPVNIENLSRETFVIFLQPAWSKVLFCHETFLDQEKFWSGKGISKSCEDAVVLSSTVVSTEESHQLMQKILRKIPPLSSRLRDGMTFAEFSRETTKQYYGGSGTQSQK